MNARALVAFAGGAAIALVSADAKACDCSTPTQEVEYARAARVVVVRVDPGSPGAHADRDGRPRSATLPVERSFKGTEKAAVEVKLSAGKDCMYFPAAPGRHIVYLHAHQGEGAPLAASDCGHNALVTSAKGIAELAALEAMSRDASSAAPTPPTASAPAAPSATGAPSGTAAPSAPTSRGCAGCATGGPPAHEPLAIVLGVGAIVGCFRRRGGTTR